jgi:AGZA family xanthine/uracil permease-like MFS transporter
VSEKAPTMPLHFPTSPKLTSLPSLAFADEDRNNEFADRYEDFKDSPSSRTLLELLFKIEERGSTVKQEIYCGVLGFVSVASILAINPSLLVEAGYDKHDVTSATALFAGLACIATGMFSNLPFIMMPVLGTSIYMSVYMAQYELTVGQGNVAVFMLGIVLTICSWRPLAVLLAKMIPKSTNTGIFIGVGLLCALEV